MTVEVFSDVACPFCYIGERHFEEALAQSAQTAEDVTWRWRPFQLQPDLPKEGRPWRAFAEKKFGSWERAQAAFGHVAQMGEAAGLDFRLDRLERAANTSDAHRLVLWATEQGRGREAAQALFAAYFTDGRDVGNAAALAALAEAAGLDGEAARDMLASKRFAADVEASQKQARELGVTGVPFYIFRSENGERPRAISGAQPVEVFREALGEAG